MIEVYKQFTYDDAGDPKPVAIDLRSVVAVRQNSIEYKRKTYDYLLIDMGAHFHEVAHDFDNFLVDWRAWRKP